MNILAICGSLRIPSSNYHILLALSKMCPPSVVFTMDDHIGRLPHFVPGDEGMPTVLSFRNAIRAADVIVFCSPEYAHGMPGSLKNAIDWCVTSNDFFRKRVVVITAASSGDRGHAALLQTMNAVAASVITDACLLLPHVRAKVTAGGVIEEETLKLLQQSLETIINA